MNEASVCKSTTLGKYSAPYYKNAEFGADSQITASSDKYALPISACSYARVRITFRAKILGITNLFTWQWDAEMKVRAQYILITHSPETPSPVICITKLKIRIFTSTDGYLYNLESKIRQL